MVRTYIRKTDQGQWDPEKMKQAIDKILKEGLSIRRAAEIYSVPFTSLQRRVTTSRGEIKRRGGQQAMDEDTEKKFVDRLVQLTNRGFEITQKAVRKYAFEFAESQNAKHHFNKKARMAGEDWFHRFMRRNENLTIRKPESRARTDVLENSKISEFYQILEQVMDDNNLRARPECVYTVNGTWLSLNNTTVQKAAEDNIGGDETVTVLASTNAVGQFIPPFILLKDVRKQNDNIIGLSTDTEVIMTENGWITEEDFKLWLKHFNRYRNEEKVILILDGNASYMNYSVIDSCDSLNIELVLVPADTSLTLQPLEVSFFKLLKFYYYQQVTAWQHLHPKMKTAKDAFGGFFKQAWSLAATVENAAKGFEKTGIHPLNVNAISEYEFSEDEIYQELNPIAYAYKQEAEIEKLSTSSQKSRNMQPFSTAEFQDNIKEILPSLLKTIPASTEIRKTAKSALPLTSDSSENNFPLEVARKRAISNEKSSKEEK